MKQHLLSMLAAVAAFSHVSSAFAVTPVEQVEGLAQGCYSIESPATDKYVKQYHSGGIINDGESFGFRAGSLNQADRFFFKPTGLGKFLLTNVNDRYLASRIPAEPTAGKSADKFAEWKIQGIRWGNSYRYRLHNQGIGRMLRHNTNTNNFYYFDLLNPNNEDSEHEFRLVARDNCKPHVEMQVNVRGNPDALKGNVNQPVRGVMDAHTHIMSNEFMGGKFIHGNPFHAYGVESALTDSSIIHGPNGALDLIGNIFAFDNLDNRYDTRGWPDFPHWPNHQTVSHSGYYYKWMERAWLGGVRMLVSHMVENKVLCTAQSTINPAAWLSPNSCEAKDSVRLQIQRHREMQDYIDAQSGGKGKGWFRLVTSPAEARSVIADGKLAVIMGIEASEIFDCGVQSENCSISEVEHEMQEMYDLGIRGFFPTHRFDNLLGGSEVEGGFLNVGQSLSAGYLFDVDQCDAQTEGASLIPGFPLIGDIPILGDLANAISEAPDYDPLQRSCNQQGLTEIGAYTINRMIDMGFLIELDHTSNRTANSILDIAEERNYSGLISAHSHLQKGRNQQLHPNMKRLMALGGFTSPINTETHEMSGRIERYLDQVETTPFLNAVGVGTDMSGLAVQAAPRSDASTNPLGYPFTSEFGLMFDRQISGNRIMDFNSDGLAHYGLLADQIQDIREQAPARVYEALMNSTEAYLQMWERATTNNNNQYVNPLNAKVRIVNRHSNKCLGIPGNDDNVNEFVRVVQESCDHKQQDQRWIYKESTGRIASALNRNLCLDPRQTQNGGEPLLRICRNNAWANWNYVGYSLRNRANASFSLDASKGNSKVQMWGTHNDWNQQWELRTDREHQNWVTFRTAQGNGCIDLHNADARNGNYLKLYKCNGNAAQQFYYDAQKGSIRSRVNSNYCVDLPSGNTDNGNRIVVWQCNGGVNQQWDYDGSVFRSRLDTNKVIDANGSSHGSKITIWRDNGGRNQRWRAVLQ